MKFLKTIQARALQKLFNFKLGLFLSSKNLGFTLIELLVAMVISGVALVSVMTSFWLFIQTHQKVEINREIQREMRFVMTRIADKTRNYSINYDQYTGTGDCAGIVNRNHKLCLEQNYNIEFRDENIFMNEQPLFSDRKFIIKNVFFGFSPGEDPRENIGIIDLQIQPKVTVFIEAESRKIPEINLKVQTTLSSRKY